MHVLYLIDSLIAGGAERSLAALAPEYAALGIDLDVAYLYERDNVWAGPLRAAGASLYSLAGDGGRVGAVRRVRRLVSDRAPQVLHTSLFEADVAGRLAAIGSRVPVVCSLVNEAYGPEQLADPRIANWKLRTAQLVDALTARRVTRFHAVSSDVAEVMAARLKLPRDRIDVIPRGRDPREMGTRSVERRTAARTALGVRADEALVLAIGRHEYQKGFDTLMHAFAAVRRTTTRPARLMIAGRTGTASDELERLAAESGLCNVVDFLGFRDDVPDLLCAADAYVSTSRWEGSPGTILEAMALETPIVATDIAAVREVFGAEPCARLVPVDDPDAIAAALVDCLEDRDTTSMTAAARHRFLQRFTIERVAAEMVAIYERAIGAVTAERR